MGKKLIEIKKAKKVIFVGDTHGDLEISQKIIQDYLRPGNKIIFLGDYVDRGKFSKENLDFLLKERKLHPDQIFLLQGNHEGYSVLKFSPAEFWESLEEREYEKYARIVKNFPLAVVVNSIIALHGALPNFKRLEDFEKIKIGDENWFNITWGDFYEKEGENLGIDVFTGRPQFGKDYFFKIMKNFNKKVLIRSHQPDAPLFMFNNQCLTIFTSLIYNKERMIAVVDFQKIVNNIFDLKIVKI